MRVLVTGATGFLGAAIAADLSQRGFEVVRLSRKVNSSGIACDLRHRADVFRAMSEVGTFDGVVHLAAQAHNLARVSKQQLFEANYAATKNLVDALASVQSLRTVKFLFASSVAVSRSLEVGLWRHESPSSAYGRSKLAAEKFLADRSFGSLYVMRFAPVYDANHLADVRKRVFCPLFPVKLLVHPPPLHYLCSLSTAIESVREALGAPYGCTETRTICDTEAVSQHALASWFAGSEIHCSADSLLALASIFDRIPLIGRHLGFMLLKFAVGHAR